MKAKKPIFTFNKRIICLTLAILSFVTVIDRAIRVANGTTEWWKLCSAIVITAIWIKLSLYYRKTDKTDGHR